MKFEIVDAEKVIFLQSCRTSLRTWEGKSPQKWFTKVGYKAVALGALITSPTRDELYRLWADPTVTVADCAWVTMAWGGMRTDHGRMLEKSGTAWIKVCEQIRDGFLSRYEAYYAFSELKKTNRLKGMGPAYFTKLIHFAGKDTKGYILDQWTARSVHVLTNQDSWPKTTISAGRNSKSGARALRVRVNDNVSAADCENYCSWIDDFAASEPWRSCDGASVEERLFSSGGSGRKAPHPWREYVMTSWETRNPPFYTSANQIS